MAKRKKGEGKTEIIVGQVSIWDIEILNKPNSFTKIEEKTTENINSFTEILNEVEDIKIDKSRKIYDLTENQKEFLDKNKIMEDENLSRLILYCGGGLGIEIFRDYIFKTLYVNKDGQQEFYTLKKATVLPMDKILFHKGIFEANELQEQLVLDFKDKGTVIRRKGDENIIVQDKGKIISINSKGWILEFNNCKAVYTDGEIEKEAIVESLDIKELQQSVKIGDIVEAKLISRTITGKITHVYGMHNMTLNISFDNHTKNTAIPRCVVTKILKRGA